MFPLLPSPPPTPANWQQTDTSRSSALIPLPLFSLYTHTETHVTQLCTWHATCNLRLLPIYICFISLSIPGVVVVVAGQALILIYCQCCQLPLSLPLATCYCHTLICIRMKKDNLISFTTAATRGTRGGEGLGSRTNVPLLTLATTESRSKICGNCFFGWSQTLIMKWWISSQKSTHVAPNAVILSLPVSLPPEAGSFIIHFEYPYFSLIAEGKIYVWHFW